MQYASKTLYIYVYTHKYMTDYAHKSSSVVAFIGYFWCVHNKFVNKGEMYVCTKILSKILFNEKISTHTSS